MATGSTSDDRVRWNWGIQGQRAIQSSPEPLEILFNAGLTQLLDGWIRRGSDEAGGVAFPIWVVFNQ